VILVGGLTYWEIKCRALNGHRERLTDDQLGFVGVLREPGEQVEHDEPVGWLSAAASRHIDALEDELARIRDIAPGWYELARKIVDE
jgi:hypothetical protein